MKDQNIIGLNKLLESEEQRVVDIDEEIKERLLLQMEKDSQLLKKHNLIDYSLFLI